MLQISDKTTQLLDVARQAWKHPQVNKNWAVLENLLQTYAAKHYGNSLDVMNAVTNAMQQFQFEIEPQVQPQTQLQTHTQIQSAQQSQVQPQPQPQTQPYEGGESPQPAQPVVQSTSGHLVQTDVLTDIDRMGHIICDVWKRSLKLKPDSEDISYKGSRVVSRWIQLFFDRNIGKVSFDKLAKARNDLIHEGISETIEIEQRSGHVVTTVANPDWQNVLLTDVDSTGKTKFVRIGRPNHPTEEITVPLGIDMDGQSVRIPLDTLLISGMRGGGKSNLQKLIPAALMLENTPWNFKFLMIETAKKVGMNVFRDSPWGWRGLNGCYDGVINSAELALKLISEELREFEERRYAQFAKAGVESIEEYNGLMDNPKTLDQLIKIPPSRRPMYRLLVNIEEIADLTDLYEDDFVKPLTSRIEQSRAAGILWILGTQRPEPKVIHTRISQNMVARIAVACGTQKNYRVALGITDTNQRVPELQGRGEAILRYKGVNTRIQTLYADKNLIRNIVERGKEKYGLLNEGLV